MAALNRLSAEEGVAWKDRVAIVPISIDARPERVKSHVAQHGWERLEHYWAGESTDSDFNAPAARAFVVSGVPQAILIGPDGRILWRGHPLGNVGGQNLKSRIEAELGHISAIRELVEFIRTSKRGICGPHRYASDADDDSAAG